MIAIDTNILVRVLVNDPKAEEQCRLTRELMAAHSDVWVCKIVLVETVWVLQSAYQFTKEQIILVLEKLIQHPNIHLEDSESLDSALTIFSASNAGFADCLILNDAQRKNCVLHTFDIKLSKLHGAKRVEVGR
jgi:predicted nucleic-acid-binding protein